MEIKSFMPQFDWSDSSKLGNEVIIKFRESESKNQIFSKGQFVLNYEDCSCISF